VGAGCVVPGSPVCECCCCCVEMVSCLVPGSFLCPAWVVLPIVFHLASPLSAQLLCALLFW
jgi:hypothetical protein